MGIEEKKQLTKDWICTMLYTGPKDFQDLIKEGCKVMVYGWEYDEFVKIVSGMVTDSTIFLSGSNYNLTTKGLYNVKKNTVVPLLNLTANSQYAQAFIQKNKENCDYLFLESLTTLKTEKDKENRIIEYAKNNYDKLAKIIFLITKSALDSTSTPSG